MGCIVCGESSLSEQVESSFVRQGALKKTLMTTMTEGSDKDGINYTIMESAK